jgi:hypothetical protein
MAACVLPRTMRLYCPLDTKPLTVAETAGTSEGTRGYFSPVVSVSRPLAMMPRVIWYVVQDVVPSLRLHLNGPES